MLLTPLEEFTKEISSSTAAASDIIPSITVLKRLLERTADTDHGGGSSKSTLLEAVQRWFSEIEKEHLYKLATVLDPRLVGNDGPIYVCTICSQCMYFKQTTHKTALQREPPEEYMASEPDPEETSAAKKPCSILFSLHGEILKENTEVEQHLVSPLSVQVQSYLLEVPIGRDENAVAYWRINKDRFPAQAQLARANLCVPCTSVDSERLFSFLYILLLQVLHLFSLKKYPTNTNLPHMTEWLPLSMTKKYVFVFCY
uniref:HAT C-terminal dimerisation domain-containing protein n=1 Tax=Echeneis naucrates TaxID=173247 RepID=A0A665VZJ8_ECHNA